MLIIECSIIHEIALEHFLGALHFIKPQWRKPGVSKDLLIIYFPRYVDHQFMCTPQPEQQAVAARIEAISQTSITEGLLPLKAFRMFLASSIHCPSTPHFAAIERAESS